MDDLRDSYIQFADDITLFCVGPCYSDVLTKLKVKFLATQNTLGRRGLVFNFLKCQFMFVGTPQQLKKIPADAQLHICGQTVTRTESITVLGIEIDQSLSFSSHITKILSKVSSYTRVLAKKTSHLPMSHRSILAQSLVYPHFIYADPVWSHYSSTTDGDLCAKQRNLARYVLYGNGGF